MSPRCEVCVCRQKRSRSLQVCSSKPHHRYTLCAYGNTVIGLQLIFITPLYFYCNSIFLSTLAFPIPDQHTNTPTPAHTHTHTHTPRPWLSTCTTRLAARGGGNNAGIRTPAAPSLQAAVSYCQRQALGLGYITAWGTT